MLHYLSCTILSFGSGIVVIVVSTEKRSDRKRSDRKRSDQRRLRICLVVGLNDNTHTYGVKLNKRSEVPSVLRVQEMTP